MCNVFYHKKKKKKKEDVEKYPETEEGRKTAVKEEFLPKVDLSHLPDEKRKLVEEMLRENCHAFSQDDEVGCMTDVQMKINLSDTKPVQKRYNSIPRPLYPEVKAYVEDLINRNWIKKSESPYSSPKVVVRKKTMVR